MSKQNFKVALDCHTRRVVHIDEVEEGFKNGLCPTCNERLIAANLNRSTRKKDTYFRHKNQSNCSGETLIHLWSKQIIHDHLSLIVPSCDYSTKEHNKTPSFNPENTWKENSITFTFNSASLEKTITSPSTNESRIPDVTLFFNGSPILYVEIHVTHRVNNEKKRFFEDAKLNCLEIDMSDVGYEELSNIQLFEDYVLKAAPRHWVSLMRYRQLDAMDKLLIAMESKQIIAHQSKFAIPDYENRINFQSESGRYYTEKIMKPRRLLTQESVKQHMLGVTGFATHQIHCKNIHTPFYIEVGEIDDINDHAVDACHETGSSYILILISDVPQLYISQPEVFSNYILSTAKRLWAVCNYYHEDEAAILSKLKNDDRKIILEQKKVIEEEQKLRKAWRIEHESLITMIKNYSNQNLRSELQQRLEDSIDIKGTREHSTYAYLNALYGDIHDIINTPVENELVFNVHRTVWQWEVYQSVVLNDYYNIELNRAIRPLEWNVEAILNMLYHKKILLRPIYMKAFKIFDQRVDDTLYCTDKNNGLKVDEWKLIPRPKCAINGYIDTLIKAGLVTKNRDWFHLNMHITKPIPLLEPKIIGSSQ